MLLAILDSAGLHRGRMGRNWRRRLGHLSLLFLLVLEAACSTIPTNGGYYEHDGPGSRPLTEVLNVPNAVPKPLPLSPIGNQPYTVFGKTYYPLKSAAGYRARGIASWYGRQFGGKFTSDGERYNMYAMTAAHRTLPLPSYARVTNLRNGRSVVVRVNDRGPFLDNRLIDLSYAAAAKLGMLRTGTALVEVDGIVPGDHRKPGRETTIAAGSNAGMGQATADTESPPQLYLQVGAFVDQYHAEALRQKLKQADFGQVCVQTSRSRPTVLFRVRIGPLPSVADCDRLARRVAAYGIRGAYAVVE